jgi:uncharacterized membrane protein
MNPLLRAGIVLGTGLGGFFDGIVLHQILGWHHLICVTAHCQPQSIAQLKAQNTQDGFFHLGVWILTLVGTVLLFRASDPTERWAGKTFAGAMVAGWGIFNLVEGLIDHEILGIHHVLPGHPQQFLFDMMFLGAGLAFVIIGWGLCRSGRCQLANKSAPSCRDQGKSAE